MWKRLHVLLDFAADLANLGDNTHHTAVADQPDQTSQTSLSARSDYMYSCIRIARDRDVLNILSESAKYPQKYCMGLVQGNVWGVSMDQKFLKDTPQFYSFSSVVHAEFCWICGLFPQ